MANTVKFDRGEVVDKAMRLFWERGFQATSMRNLQQAVNLRPGSLYASFGSKEALFREALRHYARLSREKIDRCMAQSSSPLQGLKSFVRATVTGPESQAPSNLCLLVKTVTELSADNDELLAEAREQLATIETRFREALLRARQEGELEPNADIGLLASYLQMQIMGLRTYAQACDSIGRIEPMIDEIFVRFAAETVRSG